MTFSIIARCPHSGRLGLGIATFSIGAGGRCEGILAGVGICKTQAYTNRGNDPLAIELLAQGHNPAHVMKMLEHNDPDHALSDGAQSLEPGAFTQLMAELRIIAPAIGRRMA